MRPFVLVIAITMLAGSLAYAQQQPPSTIVYAVDLVSFPPRVGQLDLAAAKSSAFKPCGTSTAEPAPAKWQKASGCPADPRPTPIIRDFLGARFTINSDSLYRNLGEQFEAKGIKADDVAAKAKLLNNPAFLDPVILTSKSGP